VEHLFSLATGEVLSLSPPLSPAKQLTLRFEDQLDGTPLSNLELNLSVSSAPFSGSLAYPRARGTGNDGEITFKGLLSDTYRISATHYTQGGFTECGYSSAYLKGAPVTGRSHEGDIRNIKLVPQAGGYTHIIQCRKGTLVKGLITSEVDLPLNYLYVDYVQKSGQKQANFNSIQVQKDGSFEGYLPKTGGAEIQLCVYHFTNSDKKKVAPSFSAPFIVKKDESYTFKLHVTAGASVKGRLVDASGKPLVKAHINWKHLGGKDETSGLAWGETDTDGKFILHGIAPGEIKLTPRVKDTSGRAHTFVAQEGQIHDLGTITYEEL